MAAVLLACVANVSVAAADEAVTGDERIAVLKMLAARNEANFRKIETWKATYRCIDRSPGTIDVVQPPGKPGDAIASVPAKPEQREVFMIREGLVDIALDVAGDRLWTDFREDASKTQALDPRTKETVKKPDYYQGYQQRTVVTPDSEIEFRPNVKFGAVPDVQVDPVALSGGNPGRLAERKAYGPTLKSNQTGAIIDARHFYMEGRSYIWEHLNINVDALLGKYGNDTRAWFDQHTKIIRRGAPGALEYEVTNQYHGDPQLDAIGLPTSITTYSERNGFLPVEKRKLGRSGELNLVRSWRYRQVEGILVPAEYRYTLNAFKDGKTDKGAFLVLDRHLLLVEAKLNGPLPAELFGPDGMKFQRGDRLIDRIEQKLYVHDGRAIVPAETYCESPRWKGRWLLCANIVVSIAVATLLVWRWRLRRARGA
jgi:hypothetical protein